MSHGLGEVWDFLWLWTWKPQFTAPSPELKPLIESLEKNWLQIWSPKIALHPRIKTFLWKLWHCWDSPSFQPYICVAVRPEIFPLRKIEPINFIKYSKFLWQFQFHTYKLIKYDDICWFKKKYYSYEWFLEFYDEFMFPSLWALKLWILQYSKEINMICNVKNV